MSTRTVVFAKQSWFPWSGKLDARATNTPSRGAAAAAATPSTASTALPAWVCGLRWQTARQLGHFFLARPMADTRQVRQKVCPHEMVTGSQNSERQSEHSSAVNSISCKRKASVCRGKVGGVGWLYVFFVAPRRAPAQTRTTIPPTRDSTVGPAVSTPTPNKQTHRPGSQDAFPAKINYFHPTP